MGYDTFCHKREQKPKEKNGQTGKGKKELSKPPTRLMLYQRYDNRSHIDDRRNQ